MIDAPLSLARTRHLRLLPGCQGCGARHPLAIDVRASPSRCLVRRRDLPPLDDGETVPAVVTGMRAAIGRPRRRGQHSGGPMQRRRLNGARR